MNLMCYYYTTQLYVEEFKCVSANINSFFSFGKNYQKLETIVSICYIFGDLMC